MVEYRSGDTLNTTEMTTQAEELRAGRTILINTVGTSMQPLLYENDTQVVVVPLQRPLKKGDMVLYESSRGYPIIHRVTAVTEHSLTLRGDHVLSFETIPYEQAAGLVTEVFRHGRHYLTDGWQMRLYAKFVAGVFPLKKAYRALRHKLAETLPRPLVRAIRALIRKPKQ